jgi:hypothetical protein
MDARQRQHLMDILERIRRIEQIVSEGETVFRASFMHQDTIRVFETLR